MNDQDVRHGSYQVLQILLLKFTRIALHFNLLILVIELNTILKIDKLLLTTQLNILRYCVDFYEGSESIIASVEFDPVNINPV